MAAAATATATAVINGSRGEGGGQLLRNAISYAAILGKAVQVQHIRASRSNPGLAAQHATALRLAKDICGGALQGDVMRSQTVEYTPDVVDEMIFNEDERTLVGDTGTAGSICLLVQAALPCALLHSKSPCCLILRGGTNASMAPQFDYWEHVFLPTVARFGLPDNLVSATVECRGYYPRGGGEVRVRTIPFKERPMTPMILTERGDVCEVYIRSHHAGKLPRHVAEQMVKGARPIINECLPNVTCKVDIVSEPHAVGSGSGILLVAKTTTGCLLGGSALGAPGKRARHVGAEAANELKNTLADGGCVDEWLQDQLILFMALANGTSEMVTGSLTLHTRTAIWVATQLCGAKFTVTNLSSSSSSPIDLSQEWFETKDSAALYGKEGRVEGRHLIQCQGISYVNTALEGRKKRKHCESAQDE